MMPAPSRQEHTRLMELIDKHGLQRVRQRLIQAAQPVIRFSTRAHDRYEEVGNTRFGGVPDLPGSIPWPAIESGQMIFLAQINLKDVPASKDCPLPQRGMLYFFLGNDEPAWNVDHRVLYYTGPRRSLHRAERPKRVELVAGWDCEPFRPYRMEVKSGLALPGYHSAFYSQLSELELADAYLSLRAELDEAGSQLLGYPDEFGGSPTIEAEFYKGKNAHRNREKFPSACPKRANAASREWLLFFDLASHRKIGMNWWDAGSVQFFIRKKDLLACRFDNTYARVSTS